LIVCLSESVAFDSCLSYYHVSGKNTAVILDREFVPAHSLVGFENAQYLEEDIAFFFVGPTNTYFNNTIQESGLMPRHLLPWVSVAPIADSKINREEKINPSGLTFILELIDELLNQSPDLILIPDAGSARKIILSNYDNKSYLTTTGLTAMGWAIRALRGVRLGCTERLPIVVVGDGSMLLWGSELATLVSSQSPCLVILLINGQLGNRNDETVSGNLSKLPVIEWQMFVEALGATYSPIEDWPSKDFVKELLRTIQEENRPIVIPVSISGETEYIYSLKTGIDVLDLA